MPLPRFLPLALICAFPLHAQSPEVQEKRLPNGARILLVERPGSGSVHLRLLFRGGLSEFVDVPPSALKHLARAAFLRMDDAELAPGLPLEALLERISGATDGLRKAEQRWVRSGIPDPLEPDLKALTHDQLSNLNDALPKGPDLMEGLGATRRRVRVGSDFIETCLDLPSAALEGWAKLETARLAVLRLPRLPLLPPEPVPNDRAADLDVLLGAALSGHPYCRGAAGDPSVTLPWLEARALAKRALSPDRLVLVVVGDLQGDHALPILEEAFAALPVPSTPFRENLGTEGPYPAGARRLLATTVEEPRLLVGWRIPPADHPDTPALSLLASALGEGQASLLRRALVESGLAREVRVTFGVPGQRDTRLLCIEARPEPGHNLQELALAIEGEMLRLQQDPLTEEDLRRLQLGATVAQLVALADPESLAKALGEASAGTGDWRTAFPVWRQGGPNPEALQKAARRYLIPSQRTEAFLESDPLEANQDVLERQISAALLNLAAIKGLDAAQAEELARQTLRQLRMVPREDRQALLNLLTAQGRKR